MPIISLPAWLAGWSPVFPVERRPTRGHPSRWQCSEHADTTRRRAPDRLIALMWQPTSRYWYLHALLLIHLGAALFYRRLGESGLFLVALSTLGAKAVFDLPEAPPRKRLPLLHLLGGRRGAWSAHLVRDQPGLHARRGGPLAARAGSAAARRGLLGRRRSAGCGAWDDPGSACRSSHPSATRPCCTISDGIRRGSCLHT
jgi:hypothetical protein